MTKQEKQEIQDNFFELLRNLSIPEPIPEYVFHKTRKWRNDFCWPEQMVILEIEGGIFTGGRHSRGGGMKADFDKYNEAAIMGYRILKVVPSELCSFNTISMLRRILIFN